MRILPDTKLDFDDVLLVPKRSRHNSEVSSRDHVDTTRPLKMPHAGTTVEGCPIIAANMDSVGSLAMADALTKHNMFTALHKFYSEDQLVNFFQDPIRSRNTFFTIGIRQEDMDKIASVKRRVAGTNKAFPKMICMDVANGYIQKFIDEVKKCREKFPKAIIMAGNIVTPDIVVELIQNAGADILKIGLGSGSVCTTRLMTGVGYPQFSAISECADAAHGAGGLICSDGGCKGYDDVCKALAGGADMVMLGGMLSGTDECEGEWITEDIVINDEVVSKKFLKFHGMSSEEAQVKHYGGVASYKAAEGKEVNIPYKGSVESVIKKIKGGLRGTCSMVGADKLKDLSKCASFIRVNNTHNRVYE